MRLIDADELKENIEIAYKRGNIMQRLPIIAIIDNAPTVDLTKNQAYDKGFITAMKLYSRPQSEWIFRQGATCGGYYKCNKCGEVERAETNFCQNCGARMKKGGAK